MNEKSKKDLLTYLNNCRCCLNKFSKSERKVKITVSLKEFFFHLTQINLNLSDDNYSKFVCRKCQRVLDKFSSLRKEFINCQTKLSEIAKDDDDKYSQNAHNLTEVRIKIEPLDIDLSDCHNDNDASNGFSDDIKTEDIKEEQSEFIDKKNDENAKDEDQFEPQIKQKKKKNIEKNFKCNLCGVSHATQKTLENHMMYNHCDKMSKDEVVRIKKRNREERKKICYICGLKVDQVNKHIKKVHLNVKKFFCDHCSYSSFKRFDMSSHVLKHRKKPKKEFMCDICGTEFLRKCSMRQHLRDFHSNRDPFECSFCSQVFKTETLMKKHQKWKHEGVNKIKCPDCEKEIAKSCLEKHCMRDPETFGQQFICMECGKEFKNKRCLTYHRQSHNKKIFICEFQDCGKSYASLNQLSSHQKRHTEQKNIKCPYADCNKSYFKQQNLRIHIANAHASYRSKCPVNDCKYSCASYSYMRDHLLRHKELNAEAQRAFFIAIKQMNLVS